MSMRTRAVGPSEQQQILEIPKPITALGTVMVTCLCKLVNSRVVRDNSGEDVRDLVD